MNYAMPLLLSAFLVLTPAVDSPAANLAGSCTANAIAFKQVDTHFNSSGTAAVLIPGAVIRFVQGGNHADCVVLEFNSHTHGSGTNGADLYYDLDSGVSGEKQIYMRAVPAGPMAPHTAIFIIPSVAPGAHFVRMKVASTNADALSVMAIRMLVHYRK
jgi:hypothetical protein